MAACASNGTLLLTFAGIVRASIRVEFTRVCMRIALVWMLIYQNQTTAQTDATGESDHERLEEIEVIFGAFEAIESQALRQCWNLQRLALINCRLAKISGLDAVGTSLLHLSLSDQQITKIEGLTALTNLRSLYLQQNRIGRIEGLESCRKLQKLWLYGNRIAKIENLACCSDLRELWLQDNQIQTFDSDGSGVSTLVNLRSLQIGNNRIRAIDQFQHLRRLVHLRVLSFADEHFGSNPIVNHPEYRSYAITTLKHLGHLDGLPIDRSERSGAEDQFLAQALEFNDKLAELTLAYENELRAINGHKERGLSNAQMLQKELIEALNELEGCVTEGQQQIASEKQRQQQLRDQNTQLLAEKVDTLKLRFQELISKQVKRETRALRAEELRYEVMEQEAIAEQHQAEQIATLQCDFRTKIAFQELPDHSPDHRYIASHFQSTDHEASEPMGLDGSVQVLQTYRFFNQDLVSAFEDSTMMRNGSGRSGFAGEGVELYLYLVVNEDEVIKCLQYGVLGSINSNAESGGDKKELDSVSKWLFLFSNPVQALAFYRGTPGLVDPDSDDEDPVDENAPNGSAETPREPQIETFQLLLCRVRMPQTIELFYPEKRHLTTLDALHAVATPKGSVLPPPPSAFLQLDLSHKFSIIREQLAMKSGHVYLARKAVVSGLVLPQFLILCSKRLQPTEADENQYEDEIDCEPSTRSSTEVLNQFQQALQDEVSEYHRCVLQELDPAQVRFRTQLLDQKRMLDGRLQTQRRQIEHEKKLQDQLVRSLR